MFKKILLGFVILIAIVVAVASTRPDDFNITRTTTIDAPAARVFAQVNNLHKWQDWSPWAKMDPNAKTTYAGPVAGKNAAMSWVGNSKVGEGTMTITDSKSPSLVQFRLDFLKPFKGTNTAEFTFKNDAGKTLVTWTMSGKQTLMTKVVGLLMNCDKMVGDQFEKGLADLKTIAEKK